MWSDFSLGFALGLAGSFHCAQMCGPLAVAVTAPVHAALPGSRNLAIGAYHAGRILTYASLGAAAGWLGQSITFLMAWRNTAAVVAGLLLVVAGLFLFGWFRQPALIQITEINPAARLAARLLVSPSPTAKLFTGMLLGLLPCGLVYAGLLKALGTGHWTSGAWTMAGFGLATSIPLWGIGLVSQVWMRKHAALGMRLTALAIVLMGAVLLWRGLNPVSLACHLHPH
ncbi:MAG: sulfite exporter TauE/SafE family protein [Bryobacteraceae bacterium]|nr:sulfite exporter TauE/SafE family protein [Bryobacteraceae bacterium]MDW8377990.1 sulfite exporter TauE/SafE family protein [Bryobacterales bacterium]